jgi:hypothetical protein
LAAAKSLGFEKKLLATMGKNKKQFIFGNQKSDFLR